MPRQAGEVCTLEKIPAGQMPNSIQTPPTEQRISVQQQNPSGVLPLAVSPPVANSVICTSSTQPIPVCQSMYERVRIPVPYELDNVTPSTLPPLCIFPSPQKPIQNKANKGPLGGKEIVISLLPLYCLPLGILWCCASIKPVSTPTPYLN